MTTPPSLFGAERRPVDLSEFKPAQRTRPADAEIDRITDGTKFVSREAAPPLPSPAPDEPTSGRRPPRWYRTKRTRTVSIKTTDECLEQFYRAADDLEMKVAETFELAVQLVTEHVKNRK